MGEIADMMLDGTLCQTCGVYMEGEADFPRLCKSCAMGLEKNGHQVKRTGVGGYLDMGKQTRKVSCHICSKKVRESGLANHVRDAHYLAKEIKR